jgi:hypothetical protein
MKIRWADVRAVHPPHHAEDLVVWMTHDGKLTAAASDGTPRWQRAGFGSFHALDGDLGWQSFGRYLFLRLPDSELWLDVVEDRVVWECRGRSEDEAHAYGKHYYRRLCPLDGPYTLVELDPTTGEHRLLFQRADSYRLLWVDEDLALVAGETCMGIERATGKVRWTTSIERPDSTTRGGTTSWLVGGLAFAELMALRVAHYGLVAVRRATGEIVWEYSVVGGGPDLAFTDGDRLRWITSRHFRELHLTDGTPRIERDVCDHMVAIKLNADMIGKNVPLGDRIYAVGDSGIAFAYDVPSDRITWHAPLGARSAFACRPTIAHGKLWTIDVTGALHVFTI